MRRRFVMREGRLVELDLDAPLPPPVAPYVQTDLRPYRSMRTGEVIRGRTEHREHLRRHDLIEVGNERLPPAPRPGPAPGEIAGDIKRELARDPGERRAIGRACARTGRAPASAAPRRRRWRCGRSVRPAGPPSRRRRRSPCRSGRVRRTERRHPPVTLDYGKMMQQILQFGSVQGLTLDEVIKAVAGEGLDLALRGIEARGHVAFDSTVDRVLGWVDRPWKILAAVVLGIVAIATAIAWEERAEIAEAVLRGWVKPRLDAGRFTALYADRLMTETGADIAVLATINLHDNLIRISTAISAARPAGSRTRTPGRCSMPRATRRS
jgi:hypothetical protein